MAAPYEHDSIDDREAMKSRTATPRAREKIYRDELGLAPSKELEIPEAFRRLTQKVSLLEESMKMLTSRLMPLINQTNKGTTH